MSSRGYEVDLIESISENIALAGHIEELLREEKDEETQQILEQALNLRRRQMSRLLELGANPNPKFHCVVKHSLGAWWRQVEVWEASLNGKDFELAKEMGDLTAMCLSKYLGLEFEVCQRCLWDRMLVEQMEKERSDIINLTDKGDKNNGN